MKKNLKFNIFTLFTLFSLVLLGGCFNREESSAKDLQVYQGSNFTMNIDPTWTILQGSDFQENIPKETVVAFTNPNAYNGFFSNVNVLKEQLNAPTSAIDYGRANINAAAQNLTDYKKIDEATLNREDGSVLVHIFEARLNPSEKLTRFYQLYTTQGSTGYIITGGVLPNTPENLRDVVGATVTSFKLNIQ